MADRYWVGGNASWDGTAGTKWATTSGGAGGAAVPTTSDNVFLDANSGANTVTVASGNTGCANLDCTGFTGTLAGSASLSIAGSLTLVAAMTRTYTGTLTFSATTTGKTLTFNGKALAGAVFFNGSGGGWTIQDAMNIGTGSWALTSGSLDTNGQTITAGNFQSSGTITRSLTLGASSVTLSDATGWSTATTTNFTFDSGTSTITLTSTSQVLTFAGGGLTFYNVTISGNNHLVTVSGTNTFNNLTLGASGNGTTNQFSANQTVSGTLNCTGQNTTPQGHVLVMSSVRGTQRTLTCAAVTLNGVTFSDISGAGAASWSGTAVGDGGGNAGITFTASVTRYWVGGTGSMASSANWSASSGGASGATPPLPQDTAVFDASSFSADGQLLQMSRGIYPSIDITNVDQNVVFRITAAASTTTYLCGSLTLKSGATTSILNSSSIMSFFGDGAETFDSAGASFSFDVRIENGGGSLTLSSDFTSTFDISFKDGNFDANDFDITVDQAGSVSPASVAIVMGSGTWTVTGTGSAWNPGSSSTITAETSTIVVSNTTASSKTFAGAGKTYATVTFSGDNITITGSNTFGTMNVNNAGLTNGLKFTASTTQTITTAFSTNGSAGSLAKILSTTTTNFNISKSSGVVSEDYMSIADSNALGGATWYAGANSTDAGGGNTGWHFSVPDNGHNFGMMLTQ